MSVPLLNIKHLHQVGLLSGVNTKDLIFQLLATISLNEEWFGLETDDILQLHVERLLEVRILTRKTPEGAKK